MCAFRGLANQSIKCRKTTGERTMNPFKRRLPLVVAYALLMTGPALAEDVTLQSFDGAISITGELVSIEGTTAVIKSAIGEFRVNLLEMKCIGADCPTVTSEAAAVSIVGAASILKSVMPALVKGYAMSRLDAKALSSDEGTITKVAVSAEGVGSLVDVSIAAGTAGAGLDAIRNGTADFAVSTRPATVDERVSAATEQVLALDGLVLLAHPSNPVRVVSVQDMPLILSGQIARWSELGGFDAEINIYAQAEDAGTTEAFKLQVMDPAGASFGGKVTLLDSDQAVADAVAADPFGIGLGTFSAARNARPMIIRGACGVQAQPNEFTIRTEDYPLTQRIFLYSGSEPLAGHAGDLLDFVLSDEGQFLLATGGYIDQRVSSERIDHQGVRVASAMMDNGTEASFSDLRRMMGELVVGERLSLTFRFEFGSATLDSRALGDVKRLAELLATGDFANKEVLLVGFTDAVGDGNKNRALSLSRAGVVEQALRAAAPEGALDRVRIRTAGYGEAAPLVCNDTDDEREINRRVEVWVSDVVNNG
jgi:phosphate transport system substrate-binding protein